ncbi:uncharacterized protein LOC119263581 [Pygocentrus nattereri]|uniref:uncharacterized protein LOC119263581 n=1 Tax=Pygocentrus nattereri TaxID=42514 RepID=UPI0018911410|nr:uncharacterized protein LOC119263581 [Pygocentrus nattereri]
MFSQSSVNIPAALILILLAGELSNQHWGVTYTPERVCALKGSSVDLSCTYKHPEGLTVNRSFWFIESLRQPGVESEDVKESDQYKGRVQYSRTLNSCRMTITDLRESDAHTYRFRFYTDDPGGSFSGRGGVTLSITDLKVTVSDTDGGVKKLTCSSTCTLPNNPTYIWYRNGQPVSECESASCPVAVVSEAVSYSCAVKGSDLHSPPVYNRTSVYAASGGAVVLLLIFIAVFLWMRRRAAVTSSKKEENSGEAPRTGDDTYSALNPTTMSSDYDTLTHFRDSPSGTYSALNPNTMSSDYETLTEPEITHKHTTTQVPGFKRKEHVTNTLTLPQHAKCEKRCAQEERKPSEGNRLRNCRRHSLLETLPVTRCPSTPSDEKSSRERELTAVHLLFIHHCSFSSMDRTLKRRTKDF